jgi:DNA-binding transcriptional regulator YhcF (GntR family)
MLETAPLYHQLAEHIQSLVRAGTLRAGERVPSVRRLSQQQGVSVSTVLLAYQRLEAIGLIESRPQSGYYVKRAAPAVEEPAV